MFSFKKIFHILRVLKENQKIKDFKIDYLSYDKEYLQKYWKKLNLKRYFIKMIDLKNQTKYYAFNTDLKIDLENELLNQLQNDIENISIA